MVVAGANTHNIKLVSATLDALETGRPDKKLSLCMDKGYRRMAGNLPGNSRYEPYIRSRKEKLEVIRTENLKARRWVVEKTHSWLNRFRRVLIRWEKTVKTTG